MVIEKDPGFQGTPCCTVGLKIVPVHPAPQGCTRFSVSLLWGWGSFRIWGLNHWYGVAGSSSGRAGISVVPTRPKVAQLWYESGYGNSSACVSPQSLSARWPSTATRQHTDRNTYQLHVICGTEQQRQAFSRTGPRVRSSSTEFWRTDLRQGRLVQPPRLNLPEHRCLIGCHYQQICLSRSRKAVFVRNDEWNVYGAHDSLHCPRGRRGEICNDSSVRMFKDSQDAHAQIAASNCMQ